MRHRFDTRGIDRLHLLDQLKDTVEMTLRSQGFGFAHLKPCEVGDALNLFNSERHGCQKNVQKDF